MIRSPRDGAATEPDGSSLCLACGICCQGGLHCGARVEDGEGQAVRALGLTVAASAEGPIFCLPCPLHQENRCTVYAGRPSACRSYQCKLLRRYLAGQATWDECIRRVELAKDLLARVRRRTAAGPTGNVWEKLRSLAAGTIVADRELLMDALALLTLGKQHFRNRAKPTEILGP